MMQRSAMRDDEILARLERILEILERVEARQGRGADRAWWRWPGPQELKAEGDDGIQDEQPGHPGD